MPLIDLYNNILSNLYSIKIDYWICYVWIAIEIANNKVITNQVPGHLSEVLPPLVSDRNPYHFRCPFEREFLAWDMVRYKTSFIWNKLPQHIQNSDSIGQVKQYLSRDDPPVPLIYYAGKRKEQIIHCKLRIGMSDLNQDKVNRHIADDPMCACGKSRENAKHYLLQCLQYEHIRTHSINTLPIIHRNINTLLNGNPHLTEIENNNIVRVVHKFITDSSRFVWKISPCIITSTSRLLTGFVLAFWLFYVFCDFVEPRLL